MEGELTSPLPTLAFARCLPFSDLRPATKGVCPLGSPDDRFRYTCHPIVKHSIHPRMEKSIELFNLLNIAAHIPYI